MKQDLFQFERALHDVLCHREIEILKRFLGPILYPKIKEDLQ